MYAANKLLFQDNYRILRLIFDKILNSFIAFKFTFYFLFTNAPYMVNERLSALYTFLKSKFK